MIKLIVLLNYIFFSSSFVCLTIVYLSIDLTSFEKDTISLILSLSFLFLFFHHFEFSMWNSCYFISKSRDLEQSLPNSEKNNQLHCGWFFDVLRFFRGNRMLYYTKGYYFSCCEIKLPFVLVAFKLRWVGIGWPVVVTEQSFKSFVSNNKS